jgi:hypothetical protein
VLNRPYKQAHAQNAPIVIALIHLAPQRNMDTVCAIATKTTRAAGGGARHGQRRHGNRRRRVRTECDGGQDVARDVTQWLHDSQNSCSDRR